MTISNNKKVVSKSQNYYADYPPRSHRTAPTTPLEVTELRRLPPLEVTELRRLPPLEVTELRRLPPSKSQNYADYPPRSHHERITTTYFTTTPLDLPLSQTFTNLESSTESPKSTI